ncbi:MAG: phosphoribosylformylglycinamidine synthase subunit PurS [Candidatus Syntrophosphaera sp.]|nr:phosphoribosylformylglycinamidine synthase subunit PurS [Candidatus Syntrophosphaera sp.]
MILAKIFVRLKPNVLDPQGKAVSNSLHQLGYGKVLDTRVSKYIEISFSSADEPAVRAEVEKICSGLLANPNTETYSYTLETLEQSGS